MSISEFTETYEYNAKSDWRDYIHDKMFKCSYNIEGGKLKNKWLEPVGKDAVTFRELINKNVISESQLIGVDYNPNSPSESEINIHNCRNLFPDATFYNRLWTQFCYQYKGNDIEYIVYDLFTSTHGADFEKNITATFDLIKKCLKKINHVCLAVNADIGIAKRQKKSMIDYNRLLSKLIKESKLPELVIDMDTMYTYKNTNMSTTMGLIILEFE